MSIQANKKSPNSVLSRRKPTWNNKGQAYIEATTASGNNKIIYTQQGAQILLDPKL